MSSLSEEDDSDVGETDSHPLGNPVPPPNVDLEMLRGDRIGDTVYSGKWCIETVMKLMQSSAVLQKEDTANQDLDRAAMEESSDDRTDVVDMDEDLQNQVGALWDMTSNEEVCEYLHSVGAIESIYHIIARSRCPRATEMCVGMLANIITHDDMWNVLSSDTTIFNTVIPLMTNTDQPSLLEVMRFFNTALSHKDHRNCYTCLWECEALVTNEMIRILSGSTNCDLLKQSVELTYNLLSLDEEESLFCASFAQGDFVISLLEASKEIGYEYPSQGQNSVMDVFYHLSTYNAGALAMEDCLDQVAGVQTAYLKTLSHDLSLSNYSSVLTSLLAALDHVFCRSESVQIAVFSAPKIIRHVLKVLVTVYQRRGMYHLLSDEKKKGEKVSSWCEMDDTPTTKTTEDARSWSERAAVSSSADIKTPDDSPLVSPLTGSRSKDLNISWSERRIGTPVDQTEEVWKTPGSMKRVRKKANLKITANFDTACNSSTSDEDNPVPKQISTMSVSESGDSTVQMDGPEDTGEGINLQERSGEAVRRLSEGFIPRDNIPDCSGDSDDKMINEGHDSLGMSELQSEVTKSFSDSDISQTKSYSKNLSDSVPCNSRFDSDDEDTVDIQCNKFDEHVDDETKILEDKYQAVFEAAEEFLTSFLKSIIQRNSQNGKSSVKKLVLYLDKHCSPPEFNALLMCASSQNVNVQLMDDLVELFDHLNARHLISAVSLRTCK